MSRATVKSDSVGQPSLGDFVTFGLKLAAVALDAFRTMLREAPSLVPTRLDLPSFGAGRPCEIPETECPPRCVCEVVWEASPGETPTINMRVKNSSSLKRTFHIHATPFQGSGGSPGTIAVDPTSVELDPGHSRVVSAKFEVPQTADGDYDAEILVTGAYEQCVCVRLRVRCEKVCGDEHCFCNVEQGDPVRIRAHRWYDHFQCTELCGGADPKYQAGGQ